MDENEFLRGIEGEEQQGTDLVSGAEQLVRLKIQAGQQTQPRYEDLEIEKKADLSESIGTAAMCKGCGKIKTACGCKAKMAAVLKAALREKLAAPSPEWNKSMLAATTGLGALAGGVGTYLASRAQDDTGKSKMEENLGASVKANESKPERGLLQKLKNRETESAHGIARAFREHPVKASLMGALTGGGLGYGLGQLGGARLLRGGK